MREVPVEVVREVERVREVAREVPVDRIVFRDREVRPRPHYIYIYIIDFIYVYIFNVVHPRAPARARTHARTHRASPALPRNAPAPPSLPPPTGGEVES